jgi:hypothetical protein
MVVLLSTKGTLLFDPIPGPVNSNRWIACVASIPAILMLGLTGIWPSFLLWAHVCASVEHWNKNGSINARD